MVIILFCSDDYLSTCFIPTFPCRITATALRLPLQPPSLPLPLPLNCHYHSSNPHSTITATLLPTPLTLPPPIHHQSTDCATTNPLQLHPPHHHHHRNQIALATALTATATATRPPLPLVRPPLDHHCHATLNTLNLATTNPPPIHCHSTALATVTALRSPTASIYL
jgi:hypothetical protein